MSITDINGIAAGYVAGARLPFNKNSLSCVAGFDSHLWLSTGFPIAGSIPAAAAICTGLTPGAFPLMARGGSQDRIVSGLELFSDAANLTHYVEDRLMHMGGLVGNVATAQTVNLDLFANLANNNLNERIGLNDFTEVEWFMDWYIATGATISTVTFGVTFTDGTTATVNMWVNGATALPASVIASRRFKIVTTNGKVIRSIQNLTFTPSTGTAGNVGVTAVRRRTLIVPDVINKTAERDWSSARAPKIPDQSCLTFSQKCVTTTTRALQGAIHQAVN